MIENPAPCSASDLLFKAKDLGPGPYDVEICRFPERNNPVVVAEIGRDDSGVSRHTYPDEAPPHG